MSPAYFITGGTPEQRRVLSEVTARFCDEATFIEQARELGWVEEGARGRLSAALRAEGARAEGFLPSPCAKSWAGRKNQQRSGRAAESCTSPNNRLQPTPSSLRSAVA